MITGTTLEDAVRAYLDSLAKGNTKTRRRSRIETRPGWLLWRTTCR